MKFTKKTGRAAWCPACKKHFTQGGKEDLEKYHLVLEQRVNALSVPQYIKQEVLQTAYQDVIEGLGYCWDVKLNISKAYRSESKWTPGINEEIM